MTKKKPDYIMWIVLLGAGYYLYTGGYLAGILSSIGGLQFGGSFGGSGINDFLYTVPVPANSTLNPQYDVNLTMYPSPQCVGGMVTGRIISNMPLAQCWSIQDAGNGWKPLVTFSLDSSGYYSQTTQVNTVGESHIKALCCDSARKCAVSNVAILNIQVCGNPQPPPPPPLPAYTCGAPGDLVCGGTCPPNYLCSIFLFPYFNPNPPFPGGAMPIMSCVCMDTSQPQGSPAWIHDDWDVGGQYFNRAPSN